MDGFLAVELSQQGPSFLAETGQVCPEATFEEFAVAVHIGAVVVGVPRLAPFAPCIIMPSEDLPALPEGGQALAFIPTPYGQDVALGFLRTEGFDIDDTVDGVRAPQGRPRPPGHFYGIKDFNGQVRRIPDHPAEDRGIDFPAVLEDELHVGKAMLEGACGHSP